MILVFLSAHNMQPVLPPGIPINIIFVRCNFCWFVSLFKRHLSLTKSCYYAIVKNGNHSIDYLNFPHINNDNVTRRRSMNIRRLLLFVLVMSVSVFVLWGCPKKTEVATAPEEQAPAVEEQKKPEAAREEAKPQEPTEEEAARERAAAAAQGLQPVYFDFDQAFIRGDARAVLKANADWVKANPKVKIRIEGNSDERGTKEYNQALAQRRAASAKKYLTDLGISGSRISLISYGKEKPVCTESTEDCWQKNRRADFVAAE